MPDHLIPLLASLPRIIRPECKLPLVEVAARPTKRRAPVVRQVHNLFFHEQLKRPLLGQIPARTEEHRLDPRPAQINHRHPLANRRDVVIRAPQLVIVRPPIGATGRDRQRLQRLFDTFDHCLTRWHDRPNASVRELPLQIAE